MLTSGDIYGALHNLPYGFQFILVEGWKRNHVLDVVVHLQFVIFSDLWILFIQF